MAQISPDQLYFTERPATPGLCRGSLMAARLEAIPRSVAGRLPSVDAPSRQGANVVIGLASGRLAVVCQIFDAAGRQPPACMGAS